MKKLTVLVDADDTINELLETWVDYLNQKYGRTVRVDEINQWDMHIFFPGLSDHDLYSVLNEEEFWKMVKPKDGAEKYLKKLMEDGHDVYIVTSAHPRSVAPKVDHMILRCFPFLSWEQIIVTTKKQLIKGDVLVDDAIHNLLGGDYLPILMSAYHNRGDDVPCIARVDNWEQAYRLIRILAK